MSDVVHSLVIVSTTPTPVRRPLYRSEEEIDALWEYNKMMGKLPRWMTETEEEKK